MTIERNRFEELWEYLRNHPEEEVSEEICQELSDLEATLQAYDEETEEI